MNATEQKLTFQQETITISVQKDGSEPYKQTLDAFVAYRDGKRVGLAYTLLIDESGDPYYNITHLASGLDICAQYSVGRETDAEKWIEQCLQFADWTGDAPHFTSTKQAFKYAVIGALHEA